MSSQEEFPYKGTLSAESEIGDMVWVPRQWPYPHSAQASVVGKRFSHFFKNRTHPAIWNFKLELGGSGEKIQRTRFGPRF